MLTRSVLRAIKYFITICWEVFIMAQFMQAESEQLRKDFLTLSPHKSTRARSVRPRILPETENYLFQSLSPFYSPWLPAERAKEWT